MTVKLHPLFLADAYKISHWFQLPPDVTWVYANMTPRRSRLPGINRFLFFGLQY